MSQRLLFGWARNNEAATNRTLLTLKAFWNVEEVGEMTGSYIVTLPFSRERRWPSYRAFTLHDNGGEITVKGINIDKTPVSVASTSSFSPPLTAETVAYRIWQAMTEQEIEWEFVAPAVVGYDTLVIEYDGRI